MLHQFWLVQTQNLAEILASAEIPFVNLNLSRISAETKILDLSRISAEIWLRLETFHESGPWTPWGTLGVQLLNHHLYLLWTGSEQVLYLLLQVQQVYTKYT